MLSLRTIAVTLPLLMFPGQGVAQPEEVPYTLTAFIGGGYVRNISHFDTPIAGVNQNGIMGTVRVMWKPEYRVSAGLEVGLTHIYSITQTNVQTPFGVTDLTASNRAWPILAVFTVSATENIDLSIGLGSAISTAEVESFGSTATPSDFSSAFMLSAGYFIPVAGGMRLGTDARFTHINKYDDNNLSLQIIFDYRFLAW